MSKNNKLAFSAEIVENSWFGIDCDTEWGDKVSDEELVAAFVALLDDVTHSKKKKNLFERALNVYASMHEDGIDSFTFARNRREA